MNLRPIMHVLHLKPSRSDTIKVARSNVGTRGTSTFPVAELVASGWASSPWLPHCARILPGTALRNRTAKRVNCRVLFSVLFTTVGWAVGAADLMPPLP